MRHLYGSYKRSKYVAEHEVLRAVAEGLPASLVLPTFPLGPGDRAPTPTGKLVLDFLNGRMPGYVDTVLNVAHVDDVARGRSWPSSMGVHGRSYILGGENLTLQQLLAELAGLTGLAGAADQSAAVGGARRGRSVRSGRGAPAAQASVRALGGGPDVDVADVVRRLASPQRARLRTASGGAGHGGVGAVVRRERQGDRAPTGANPLVDGPTTPAAHPVDPKIGPSERSIGRRVQPTPC